MVKGVRDLESQKPLSKRQKWKTKCKAKRLRRKERKRSLVSSSTPKEEVDESNMKSAQRFKFPTTGKWKCHPHISASIDSDSRGQNLNLYHANDVSFKNLEQTLSLANRTSMKSSRKRKRKMPESSEEEAFAKMVDKYRRKLQCTAV